MYQAVFQAPAGIHRQLQAAVFLPAHWPCAGLHFCAIYHNSSLFSLGNFERNVARSSRYESSELHVARATLSRRRRGASEMTLADRDRSACSLRMLPRYACSHYPTHRNYSFSKPALGLGYLLYRDDDWRYTRNGSARGNAAKQRLAKMLSNAYSQVFTESRDRRSKIADLSTFSLFPFSLIIVRIIRWIQQDRTSYACCTPRPATSSGMP